MIAIEKLRAMTNWYGWQNEGLTDGLTTISQLERMYDYAKDNELEFMDDGYLQDCDYFDEKKASNFKRELREEAANEQR